MEKYGIACPKCGHNQSYVMDSRPNPKGIRRRRKCTKCGEKYTTYEYSDGEMRKMKDLGLKIGIREGKEKLKQAIEKKRRERLENT